MYYNSILSSVISVFDCFYSPGRDLGREFFSSEEPGEQEKKIFSAYGATTNPDTSSKKTPTPVEMKAMNREHAEDLQNKPESTENHDQIVLTSPNDEEHGFTKVGDEYTRFYKVQAAGDVKEDEGDFVIG